MAERRPRKIDQSRLRSVIENALDPLTLHARMCAEVEARPYCLTAQWRAASFRTTEGQPMTLRRVLALNAVLEQCELILWPGELLIGVGWIGRMSAVDAQTEDEHERDEQYLAEIGGRTFITHSDHLAPDYAALVTHGFGGLLAQVQESRAQHDDPERQTFLQSMAIALEGATRHMRRWSARLTAAQVEYPAQAELLAMQAEMLEHLATEPPRTFWEALQLVYLYHCLMQLDDRYAMAFGRMDQFLYPFYRADIEARRLDDETMVRLLEHFFAKITTWRPEVQNIALGGVTPTGEDATNELSYLILEACKRVGKPGGNVTARIHRNTPQAFLRKCAEVMRTGIGYPAVYNDEVQVGALAAQGIAQEEARDYCFAGCIEAFIPGRTAPWADDRFNLLLCVNLTLFDGFDNITGEQAGPKTGEPVTWEAFYEAFLVQLRTRLAKHIATLDEIKGTAEARAGELTSPLMSALVTDCIERGRDVNDGGARYPANHGVAAMGIGVTADALMAIKRLVYEEQRFTLAELRTIVEANFDGYEVERQALLHDAPKYGNDHAEVDALAVQVTHDFGTECLKYHTPQGGHYWGLMAANVSNIWAGLEVGASPDGRLSQQPLSDAASPTFGRDVHGPTAVLLSVAKLPYHLCPGGNVINIKLHPAVMEGEKGLDTVAAMIRTCFDLGGIQLQFNVVDEAVLREAMEKPEEYASLVVRVSGFSAFYTTLDRRVQEDILARTVHGG